MPRIHYLSESNLSAWHVPFFFFLGKARWSVTFENPDPCALKGSSAQLWCSFNYPDGETVHKTVWFRGEVKNGSWGRTELSSLPSYQNRVKYLSDQKHNCSLEIHDLRDSDTGYYYFRFDTNTYGWRSKGSVYLSVTGTVHYNCHPVCFVKLKV